MLNDQDRKQQSLNKLVDSMFTCDGTPTRAGDACWVEEDREIYWFTNYEYNLPELMSFKNTVGATEIGLSGVIDEDDEGNALLQVVYLGVTKFPWNS